MLKRELIYQLSFKRLANLSRSAMGKASPTVWRLTLLWHLAFVVAVGIIIVNADVLHASIQPLGITAVPELLIFAVTITYLLGCGWLRSLWFAQVKRRVSSDETVRLTQDQHGLRFLTDEIEHHLRWKGISQVLLERDGIAVSHGYLFFLIPDLAFADAAERLAFIRDLYPRLGTEAQVVSLRHIGPLLEKTRRVAAS